MYVCRCMCVAATATPIVHREQNTNAISLLIIIIQLLLAPSPFPGTLHWFDFKTADLVDTKTFNRQISNNGYKPRRTSALPFIMCACACAHCSWFRLQFYLYATHCGCGCIRMWVCCCRVLNTWFDLFNKKNIENTLNKKRSPNDTLLHV